MRGLMMDYPLTIPAIVRRVETLFSDRKVVSRRSDRSICRSTYRQVVDRVRRLAVALQDLGVKPGDRVATLVVGEPGTPRGVSRDSVDRGGPAHAEPSPAPRRSHLHRERRGRPGAHRRRKPVAALREVSGSREHRACDRRSVRLSRTVAPGASARRRRDATS